MKKLIFILLAVLSTNTLSAQKIEIVSESISSSLRGLSAVDNNVVWASGSNGAVGKTTDGGKTWKWMTVKGFEKTDFRDIEAFDAKTSQVLEKYKEDQYI